MAIEAPDGLELKSSPGYRSLAYFDENYEKTLMSILDGVISKEDVLDTLNLSGTWEPVGEGRTISTTTTFMIRNFTSNFFSYRILVSDIKSNTSQGRMRLKLSTDNGDTLIEDLDIDTHDIFYNGVSQPRTDSGFLNQRQVITRANVYNTGNTATTMCDIMIHQPMDPTKYTRISTVGCGVLSGLPTTPVNGYHFGKSWGVYKQTTPINALGLQLGAGTSIDDGFVQVWGQRADL